MSFVVTTHCRYHSRPFSSHLTATKRVHQYPKSPTDVRLHCISSSTGSNDQLTGYADSDWANDSADQKSQGGHIFLLSNRAVLWQSRKQDPIAMSTLQAKYIACSEGSHEAKWLLQLHRDIHGEDASPLLINCDNQGPLSRFTTVIIKARTKHINV
jgi:hypothetical protein